MPADLNGTQRLIPSFRCVEIAEGQAIRWISDAEHIGNVALRNLGYLRLSGNNLDFLVGGASLNHDRIPMNSFLPFLDVPLDLPFVREVLMLDSQSATEIYSERLDRSVRIGLQNTSRFDWPNIYDLIEYIVKRSLTEYSKDSSYEVIVDSIVDELACCREFLSFEFVSFHTFKSDPSGLVSALKGFEEVVLHAVHTVPITTNGQIFAAVLCERIRSCATQFNVYLVKIFTAEEHVLQ